MKLSHSMIKEIIKPLEDAISKLYVDLEEVETKRKTILSKYL